MPHIQDTLTLFASAMGLLGVGVLSLRGGGVGGNTANVTPSLHSVMFCLCLLVSDDVPGPLKDVWLKGCRFYCGFMMAICCEQF